MVYTFRKQTVAVIGASGQIGRPLTKALLDLGHTVKILTRATNNSDQHDTRFDGWKGDKRVVSIANMNDVGAMASALKGAETVVCAVPASQEIVTVSQPLWLEAAVQAGVKRFVPSEFGAHTRGLEMGEGIVFDAKKKFHEKIFAQNANKDTIGWTFFYNGGIMDYFILNLRFFEKITTFGDLDAPLFSHDIEDIGRCAAYAVTDDRTLNKCVQMDFNIITQREMLEQLKANFPDHPFEYEHFSTEHIIQSKSIPSNENSSKKGAETDQERWGINYVVYVAKKLGAFTDETLRGTELYPNFKVSRTPDDALKDPTFVFEAEQTTK